MGEVLDLLKNPVDIQAVLGVQQSGRAVRNNAVGNSDAQNAGGNFLVLQQGGDRRERR